MENDNESNNGNGNGNENENEIENKKAGELFEGLLQELRRGTIIISVLSLLGSPQYGYSLVTSLEHNGIGVDPGTLYPLLRRLEKQELLKSEWDINNPKPRKYYQLSEYGKVVYERLCREWTDMSGKIDDLISNDFRKGVD